MSTRGKECSLHMLGGKDALHFWSEANYIPIILSINGASRSYISLQTATLTTMLDVATVPH